MKLNFDKIIKDLNSKATSIYDDRDKIWELLSKTKNKLEENKELRSLFDDVKIIVELVKDYYKGHYKNLTKNSIVLVIISLVYLVNPLDIIPDFLLGGFIDDAAVIAYILKKITTEIDAYKEWKTKRPEAQMTEDDIIDLDEDDMIEITLNDKEHD